MRGYLIALCGTDQALALLFRGADTVIALAYFSIPLSMLWVLRNRQDDLPYPGLWLAFVLFIFACGGTNALHAIGLSADPSWRWLRTGLQIATAAISIVTAIALNLALPAIAKLPSPRKQQQVLEEAVAVATQDKTALLFEIHHRVGNQLAKIGALVRIEMRRADPAALPSLERIQDLLEELGEEHKLLSSMDYTQRRPAQGFYDAQSGTAQNAGARPSTANE